MSDQMLENYDKNTIQNQLRDILARIASLEQRDVVVDNLEEFSPDLGNVNSGDGAVSGIQIEAGIQGGIMLPNGSLDYNKNALTFIYGDEGEIIGQVMGYANGSSGYHTCDIDVTAPFGNRSLINLITRDGAGNVAGKLSVTNEGVNWNDVSLVSSGTYTPTGTKVTNLDSVTTYESQYMRVGNVVSVSGRLQLNLTASGTGEAALSLPIASDFTAAGQCAGVMFNTSPIAGLGGAIYADSTNNRAHIKYTSTNTGDVQFMFTFTYLIL